MDDEHRRVPNEDPGPPPERARSAPRSVTALADRRPLSDLDAEAAVLSSVLQRYDETWDDVVGLSEPDFYWPSYQLVFAAMCNLARDTQSIHPISVVDELRRMGVLADVKYHEDPTARQGAAAVHHLGVLPDVTHRRAASYAKIVARWSRSRKLLNVSERLREAARVGDLDAALPAVDEAAHAIADAGPGQVALQFEDVGAVIRGEVPDVVPTMLRRTDDVCLVYPGLTHWLMGEPGKGKTFVALYTVAQVIRDGGIAMYLDWEGNRQIVGSRLRAIGLTDAEVDAQLLYARPQRMGAVERVQLVRVVLERTVQFTVFDGVAKALARQGLNEDKAPEVLGWLELAANPIAEAGSAVMLLDHVSKDKEKQAYARGSGAKLGEVTGAAWLVRPKQGFSRQQGGRVDLVQAKDREGYVAIDGDAVATITFEPADNGHTLAIDVLPPEKSHPQQMRPTYLMEFISRLLESKQEPLSKDKIRQLVSGKAYSKDAALACLVDEGFVDKQKGKREGWFVYQSIAPYRQEPEGQAEPEVGEDVAGHMAEEEPF